MLLPHNWMKATIVIGALTAAFTTSCRDLAEITAPEPTSDELSKAVAGEAASVLAGGKFVLSPPEATKAEQITSVEAVQLAVAWAKQFGPLIRSSLEEERGGRIRFDRLQPCGRPLYAVNGFQEPPLDILPSVRRSIGPWWILTLCDGGAPSLSVAVSAWATELTIEQGRILFPTNGGAEFWGAGIPVGHVGEFPLSPERAAYSTSAQTGRRVTSIPYLVAGFNSLGNPHYARWQWRLDEVVSVDTDNTRGKVTRELLVGRSQAVGRPETMFTAATVQLDTITLTSPPPLIFGESRESYEERVRTQTRKITVLRRPEIPVLLNVVTAVEGRP